MDWIDIGSKVLKQGAKLARSLDRVVTSPDLEARLAQVRTKLGPYGVDPFGFDPTYVKRWLGLGEWFYKNYFRCEVFGKENLIDGRSLIIANHSGQLPTDAFMISAAAFLEHDPPIFLRSMVERFVPSTPFVSPFMARCGQLLGTPDNCRRLLDMDAAMMVFPEGVRGLCKPWKKRYKLQRFGQGFMRLAIEKNVPIIPTVVIGAEEQSLCLYDSKRLGKLIGMPSFPITLIPFLGMLPMPTKYRIYFGTPMYFEGDANDEDDIILARVQEVKDKMQAMIDSGLKARERVFF